MVADQQAGRSSSLMQKKKTSLKDPERRTSIPPARIASRSAPLAMTEAWLHSLSTSTRVVQCSFITISGISSMVSQLLAGLCSATA